VARRPQSRKGVAGGRSDAGVARDFVHRLVIPLCERGSLFADGLSRIHEVEIAMRQMAVALSAGPFNPLMNVIKGRTIVQESRQSGRPTIPALTMACQREITAETLWRAFDDGALRLRKLGDVQSADVLTR
jgi:hypothetical protein